MTYRRRKGMGGKRKVHTNEPKAAHAEATGPAPAPTQGRRIPAPRWLISLVIVVSMFGVGYLIAAEILFRPSADAASGPLVLVPELVGMNVEDAQARIDRLALEFTVRASVSHPQAPEGAVLAQSPLPGQLAKSGAPVSVTLSRGP